MGLLIITYLLDRSLMKVPGVTHEKHLELCLVSTGYVLGKY